MARTARSLRCGDSVCYLTDLRRARGYCGKRTLPRRRSRRDGANEWRPCGPYV